MTMGTLTVPFEKLWRGQHSLAKAFWGYLILGSFVAAFVTPFLALPLVLLDQRQAALPVVFTAMIAYPLFAAVGAWRSANVYLLSDANVPLLRKLYAFCAKAVVCVVLWAVFQRATGITFADVIHRLASS